MSGVVDYNSFNSNNSTPNLNSSSKSLPGEGPTLNLSSSNHNQKGNAVIGNEDNRKGHGRNPGEGPVRAISYGGADHKKPVLMNKLQRFAGKPEPMVFNARNPIRIKKSIAVPQTQNVSKEKSREDDGSLRSNVSQAQPHSGPLKVKPGLVRKILDEEIRSIHHSDFMCNLLLEDDMEDQEELALDIQCDQSMNHLGELWLNGVPNIMREVLNERIITQARTIEIADFWNSRLAGICSTMDSGLAEQTNRILVTLHHIGSKLPVRKLRFEKPEQLAQLPECFEIFEKIISEESGLHLASNIIAIQEQLETAKVNMNRDTEEVLEPTRELINRVISLTLSKITAVRRKSDVKDSSFVTAKLSAGPLLPTRTNIITRLAECETP